MSNILDYIYWRGDISFDYAELCDVDALIFSRIAYIPFDGTVSPSFSESIDLSTAAKKVLELSNSENSDERILLRDAHDAFLLEKIAESKRYSNIKVTGYINTISTESEKQFSAVTFILPNNRIFVAFRGTDGTLVGWKEDFNMSFIDTVPAQKDAVRYIETAADATYGDIFVAGHSKGGNLAVYSSAFCMTKVKKRIKYVRNFDGPGFNENMVVSEEFSSMLPKIKTFLPQSSIVGMLLEHAENFSVVFSTGSGIMQHDIYTWEVGSDSFNCVDGLSDSSQFIDATLKKWLDGMTLEQRKKMIDGIYEIMVNSDITRTDNLFSRKNISAFLKTYENSDEETKKNIGIAMKLLRQSFTDSLVKKINSFQIKKDSQNLING